MGVWCLGISRICFLAVSGFVVLYLVFQVTVSATVGLSSYRVPDPDRPGSHAQAAEETSGCFSHLYGHVCQNVPAARLIETGLDLPMVLIATPQFLLADLSTATSFGDFFRRLASRPKSTAITIAEMIILPLGASYPLAWLVRYVIRNRRGS